jgi:cytochrome c-type biogenesis protein CcmH
MKFASLLVALMLFVGNAAAAPAPGAFADPAQEARARALQKELRCLVCQGESIDESNAPLAADLRAVVRAHMVAGETDQQIKDFLVARYGNFILMKPPLETETYFLWAVPFLLLIAGLGVTILVVRRAKNRAPISS